MNDNEFVFVPFNEILKGTTLIRVIEHFKKNVGPKFVVKKIVERELKPEDVYENAKEMMVIGYDFCIPITEYDCRKIGTGKKG